MATSSTIQMNITSYMFLGQLLVEKNIFHIRLGFNFSKSVKTIFYLSNIKPEFSQTVIAKTISHPSNIKRKFSTIVLAF